MQRVAVLDNGGDTLKAGFAGEAAPRVVMPNAAGRAKRAATILVGDLAESSVRDPSQLSWLRPTERGAVVDPYLESLVWERALGSSFLDVASSPGSTGLLLTAPAFLPAALEATIDELAFERFGFGSVCRLPSAQLSAYAVRSGAAFAPPADGSCGPVTLDPAFHFPTSGTGLVIDAGYSATTVIPFVGWSPVPSALVRLDVGGKALTNYLKESVSYRQYNMMEDTWLVNGVKERLCFVAQAYEAELEVARRLGAPGVLARLGKAKALAAASGAGGTVAPSKTTYHAPLTTYARRRPMPSASAQSAAAPGGTSSGAGSGSSSSSASALSGRVVGDGDGVGIRREYVLPDYLTITKGYVKGDPREDPYVAARRALAEAHAAREAAGMDIDGEPPAARTVTAASGSTAAAAAAAAAGRRDAGAASGPTPAPGPELAARKRPRPEEAEASSSTVGTKSGKPKTSTAAKEHDKSSKKKAAKVERGSKNDASKDKATKAAADGQGGDADGDNEDDDSAISEEEEDEDSEDDSESSGDEHGDYKGKVPAAGAAAAAAPRQRASRAASAGVRDLTSSLKRSGVLEEGEDDEEAAAGRGTGASEADDVRIRRDATGAAFRPARGLPTSAGAASGGGSGLTTPDGRILPPEEELQSLAMGGERISVPELLFKPGLVGLRQGGLADAVAQAIARSPASVRPLLWSSLLLTGGTASLPGLESRLVRELQALAPAGAVVRAFTPADPTLTAWSGGSWLGSQPGFGGRDGVISLPPTYAGSPVSVVRTVTKAQWAEEGERACRRAFRLTQSSTADADEAVYAASSYGGTGASSSAWGLGPAGGSSYSGRGELSVPVDEFGLDDGLDASPHYAPPARTTGRGRGRGAKAARFAAVPGRSSDGGGAGGGGSVAHGAAGRYGPARAASVNAAAAIAAQQHAGHA